MCILMFVCVISCLVQMKVLETERDHYIKGTGCFMYRICMQQKVLMHCMITERDLVIFRLTQNLNKDQLNYANEISSHKWVMPWDKYPFTNISKWLAQL